VAQQADRARVSGRFQELDALRGLAAGIIVLGHYLTFANHVFPEKEQIPVDLSFAGFGVQLFFLISGFVIFLTVRRSRGVVDFLIARFSRLYPTFWVCLAITTAFTSFAALTDIRPTVRKVLANITMFPSLFRTDYIDGAYWSLYMEWFFYGLFALLIAFGVSKREEATLNVLTGWAVLSALVTVAVHLVVGGHPAIRVIANGLAVQYAALFATGALLLVSRERGRLDPRLLLTMPAIPVAEGMMGGVRGVPWIILVTAIFTVVALAPSIPFLHLGIFQFLGRISYSWYLLHQFIGYSIMSWFSSRYLSSALAFVVTITLATIVYELVEKRLSRRVRASLASRWRARSAPA
jgi:peptidoglycan/LPS O-acetylase OafA/YrhL